jgi:hypothetical protein
VGAEIKDTQRSVGLHDTSLFGVFVQKVAMGKKQL